jgi:acyl-coenzyme A synthetase/AMP-(fatty) acid ligase
MWKPATATKNAIIFEADDGTVTNVTYQDLLQRVPAASPTR